MENPYQSPPPMGNFSGQFAEAPAMPAGARPRGMVGHVRVLGILMMVHGTLSILMGLLLVAAAVFMGVVVAMDPPPQQAEGPPPEVIVGIVGGTYGTMGLSGLIPGILQAYAGWHVHHFRKQMGLIALFSAFASVATCYCLPTAIAISIYGLIVLFEPSVRSAFELAKEGHTPDQIDAMFNPWSYQQIPPPKHTL